MFRPPISQVRVQAPTNVHFTLSPLFVNPSLTALASLTSTFDAHATLYTYAEILINGVYAGSLIGGTWWASVSAGPTSLLVVTSNFAGANVGDTVSMRVKHTVVSGGGYPTDSAWVVCPETFTIDP